MPKKYPLEFTDDEIKVLIQKLAASQSVELALQVKDGEERLDIITKLTKAISKEEEQDGK